MLDSAFTQKMVGENAKNIHLLIIYRLGTAM